MTTSLNDRTAPNAVTVQPAPSPRRWVKYACVGAFLLVIAFFAFVRVRLRNMPLERDEGEYAYMGQLILQGIPPYKIASNMKLPGTYLAYAAIMAVFGETASGIRIGLMLATTAAAVLVFLLGNYLYGPITGSIAGITYAFLAARPAVLGIDGHATHFVVLMALAGILLLLQAVDRRMTSLFFASGLSFGLAFLMKQPGIVFALFAGLYGLFCERRRPVDWPGIWTRGAVFAGGIALPYVVTCLWILRAGVFPKFWFWTWSYAREYGRINTLPNGWRLLHFTLPWAVRPFVLWELAAIGLTALLWSRTARTQAGFVTGFFFTSCLAVSIGLYFRPHYFILLLPAGALCVGIAVQAAQEKLRELNLGRWASLPVLYFALVYVIAVYGQWRGSFRLDPVALSRKVHYDQPYADAELLADFIKAHSSPHDQIGIIGSEPEICFYTRLRCTSSYLYMFPLMEEQRFATQMQDDVMRELEGTRPRFLIYVDDERSWGWKSTLARNQSFFDQAWAFAHRGYQLVDQVAAPDIGSYPEHLWGDQARLYLFQRADQ